MRSEEEFTKNSIETYLKGTGVVPIILSGNEPPDYFVTIDNKTYPLEVTNTETIAYQDDGTPGVLRHSSTPLEDFYREINTKPIIDIVDVPPEKTVRIYIKLPIKRWDTFKRFFKALLNKGYLTLVSEIAKAFPENIMSVSVVTRPNNGIPIKFAWSAKNPEVDIALQVRTILTERVENKEKKLNKSGIEGERWLGVLNNYFFDGVDIWTNEASNLIGTHSFKRIFIVSVRGEVIDIKFE